MIHMSRFEKQILGLKSDGLTSKTVEDMLHLEKGDVQKIMSHIADRIKTASDSHHIIQIMNERQKPVVIDYKNFTFKGKSLTDNDIWRIMCKYDNLHPENKRWRKMMNEAQKILESQV